MIGLVDTADMPSSPWVRPIIQLHWPSEATVTAASNSALNRGSVETMFRDYQGVLATTKSTVLSFVEGATADATRQAFQDASNQAGEVARKNGVKKTSYTKSASALESLRSDLRQIAADAESEINDILKSKKPAPQKITEITEAIEKHSRYAAHKATNHGNVLTNAVQEVLTAQGDSRSVEEFAAANGINLNKPPLPTQESIRKYVEETMKSPTQTQPTPPSDFANDGESAGTTPGDRMPGKDSSIPYSDQADGGKQPIQQGPTPPPLSIPNPRESPTSQALPGNPAPAQAVPAEVAPSVGSPEFIPGGGGRGPAILDGPITGGGQAVPSAPPITAPSAPPVPFGPQQLAESFTNGIQTGNPVAGGAEALTHNTLNSAFQTSIPSQPDFTSVDTSPSAASHHNYETAYAPTPSVAHAMPDTGSQIYAAPVAAVAPMAPVAPIAPAAPVGPLPPYGSDIRPPTPAVAPPPVAPVSATPASAPVSPAAGTSALNQQAVIRHPSPSTAPSTPPTGLTESAVAASGAGAVSGALAEQAAATARLERLLISVARQEPNLGWAIAERDDGTTLLVTDLASGWIPSHVEIPTGVEVLAPGHRSGGLESLIGDAALVQSWTPGQYLPSTNGAEVAMSIRSRDLPKVDELNWELTQATNWRDGLPRLAHTLTKAGIAGTGILDSEADLLREHLRAICQKVLEAYPDVDPAEIGNWQLLAAIDALIDGRRTTMNYHFAWFQALQLTFRAGQR